VWVSTERPCLLAVETPKLPYVRSLTDACTVVGGRVGGLNHEWKKAPGEKESFLP